MHYKVTWNPRNVVLAGRETLLNILRMVSGNLCRIIASSPLPKKFKVEGFGKFESYPNRDSLTYISKYGLNGIKDHYSFHAAKRRLL
jgi:hypothetical protein